MRKEVEDLSKKEWLILAGVLLFMAHMVIIWDDVQAVVDDPNMDNKPAELLKLAADISRYGPK